MVDVVVIFVDALEKSVVASVVTIVASNDAVVAFSDAVAVLVADTIANVLVAAIAANSVDAEYKFALNEDGDQSVYSKDTCVSDLEEHIYELNKEALNFYSSTERSGSL